MLDILAAKADAGIPPQYTFDPRSNRYRDALGRFVSVRVVYTLRDVNEAANVETMQRLTLALAEGRISAPGWYMAMQHQLRRLHVQNAALGAGGFDRLTRQDFARIDAALREEMDRLLRFGTQVQAGLQSDAQILNRINMYAGTARKQFYASKPKPKHRINQIVIERRVLGDAEHCPLCVYLSDLGWQPYGTLPAPGESVPEWKDDQCLSNCRCEIEMKVVGKKKGEKILDKTSRPAWKAWAPRSCYLLPDDASKGGWDESQVNRHPAGTPVDPGTGAGGGRFAPKGKAASDLVASIFEMVYKSAPVGTFPKPRVLTHFVGGNWGPSSEDRHVPEAVAEEGLMPRNRWKGINERIPNRPEGIFFWGEEMADRGFKPARVQVNVSELDTDKLWAFPVDFAYAADQIEAGQQGVEGLQDALAAAQPVPYADYDGSFAAEWIYELPVPSEKLQFPPKEEFNLFNHE